MKSNEIFDLSAFDQETMPVRMPNGTELNLLKPTEAIVLAVAGLKDLSDDAGAELIMRALHACVKVILNNNDAGIVISDTQIKGLNVAAKNALLHRFTEWIAEIEARPNSKSRRWPPTRVTGRKRDRKRTTK
ncbi:MAG: hypothetical protein FWF10_08020 [Clostridiales bacterium]|nr:hypothetical protein [Clostridiales bacterium]